jgi:DMSO/TMAO reductase YedYZ molybdopterin-dependent catalytic subunit
MRAMAAVAGAAALDPGPVLARVLARQSPPPCAGGNEASRLIATLPLSRPGGVDQPFGVKIGGPGLDARLMTDLSKLQPGRLITPNAQAYIRTERPAAVAAHQGPWIIRGSGLLDRPATVSFGSLMKRIRPMGAHLFECSGNSNPANFGLMSVAEWRGVPLADMISMLRPSPRATAVLVSGVDPDLPSTLSVNGASWVMPLASLDRLGAFLAVTMNGDPLPHDHGFPLRLAVPGWYGCAWIKWVDEIRFVDDSEPATSQMREFAARTHQTAVHDLAREYAPPSIQTAATVIRVEKRAVAGGLEYRVAGIVWGGERPVSRLAIRFGDNDSWKEFDVCPAPATPAVWSLWTYRWKPAAPGTYSIALRVPDSTVPQRRLDMGYYVRNVRIDEV